MLLKYSKKNINEIAKKFKLKLILIFGSYAKNTFNKESDLDIAVLADCRLNFKEYKELYSELSIIFSYNIDLTFLREADPLLMKQVIENCQLIYEDKKNRFSEYRVYAYKRYMDHKKFFDLEEKYIKSSLETYAK